MDDASQYYVEAVEAWERGDRDTFLESAAEYNQWLRDEGFSPMTADEWAYDQEIDYDDIQGWIDQLSHDERDEFFGY